MNDSVFLNSDPTSRRRFIQHIAQSFLGVSTVSLMAKTAKAVETKNEIGPAKSVIYIYLSGGMSHLDTFDTKPGAETQGPVESIETSADGVQVSEFLPRLSRHMHHFAVINSMNSTQGAHAQGKYYMHTSYFVRGTIQHPHMGAWSSLMLPKRNRLLPSNVKIGTGSGDLGAGFLESKHAAVPIGNPNEGLQHSSLPNGVTENQFRDRMARLRQMNRSFRSEFNTKQTRAYSSMYDEAVKLMKSRDLKAFDLTMESENNRERFGDHKFGQGCLLARRLIQHDVRFVEVNHGGWDTHNDNFERVKTNAQVLDQGLSALMDDLVATGKIKETLVVVATEFGRTPTIQVERNGRNHYPQAFTCLLGGAGIRGGQKYGKTDREGREVIENLVSVPDFNATIAQLMGLPIKKETFSSSGRPFTVADKGAPIQDILT